MSEPFIGEIVLFAGNFAPRGWAFCQGQLLSIAQNTALFSILGTTYGGDGRVTFALPDLRGRVPLGQGQGPGLSNYVLGEQSGTENVTLLITEIPQHTHLLTCLNGDGDKQTPVGNVLANDGAGGANPYSDQTPSGVMSPLAVQPAGGSQPHNNLQPYLALDYIIAMEGIFPSRN